MPKGRRPNEMLKQTHMENEIGNWFWNSNWHAEVDKFLGTFLKKNSNKS